MANTNTPQVACLGPLGTYTHQAAYKRFGESVTYKECDTISDVAHAVISPDSNITLGIVPKENSIFGTVVETFDLLRSDDWGTKAFICDEVTLKIQHCLLVRRGVQLIDVTRVLSHEQALGQCSQFLQEKLPNAICEKTSSTAGAAAALMDEERGLTSAAVCSSICAVLQTGLEVMFEGIQNQKSNFTKFWVIGDLKLQRLPQTVDGRLAQGSYALLRVSYSAARPDVTDVILRLGLPISRIDRRPSLGDTPFQYVLFIEVYEDDSTSKPRKGKGGQIDLSIEKWEERVRVAMQRVNVEGWDSSLLGVWRA